MDARHPKRRCTLALLAALLLASCGQPIATPPAAPMAQAATTSTPTRPATPPSTTTPIPSFDAHAATKEAFARAEMASYSTPVDPTILTPDTSIPYFAETIPRGRGLYTSCDGDLDAYAPSTCWASTFAGTSVSVDAGGLVADHAQGVIAVTEWPPDQSGEGNHYRFHLYPAPAKTGFLRIIAVALPRFTLQSSQGSWYVFNLATRTFEDVIPPTRTPWPAAQLAFPATPLLDDFARADGPLGSQWHSDTLTTTIHNQQVVVGPRFRTLTWDTPQAADQEAFVTLTTIDSAARNITLQLKRQDDGVCNMLQVDYRLTEHTVTVETCEGTGPEGTWLQHDEAIPVTFAAGDVFGARALGDGTVLVYRNGVPIGQSQVDAEWPYRGSGGRIGVALVGLTTAMTLDDFGGGSLRLTTPTNLPTATSTATPTPLTTDTPQSGATPTP